MSGNSDDGLGPRRGTLLNNRYRLDERIGAGGMGEVWRATDVLLSRPVAVKTLHTAQMSDPVSKQRFRTEAQITAALSHPGIAQVYDYGEHEAFAFLVMELVVGESLSTILKRNPGLDPDVALDVLDQGAQALAAAHASGVVHRDIKPGNLLVTEDGTVKLTDFGIARGNESVTLTQTGMVMGTAQYISPEQVAGKPATALSDIYALGVVAYECLAGRPPFTSDTPLALALAHTREPPPPLPESVSPPVRELVERMLAKQPQDRPASAAEVAQHARWLRSDLGGQATETLGLASATDPTMATPVVTGAATAPTGSDGAQAWPPQGVDSSDRVTRDNAAPNSRLNLPVVFALLATVGVVALGIVLVGLWWEENDANGIPASNRSAVPTLSQSPETDDIATDPATLAPENPGGQQRTPVHQEPDQPGDPSNTAPEPSSSPPPSDTSTAPADTDTETDTGGDGAEPDGGDDGGDGAAPEESSEDGAQDESGAFSMP